MPPEGVGMGVQEIAVKLNVNLGTLIRWFKRTGRPMRTLTEQAGTERSRKRQSDRQKQWWKDQGGFENYLRTRPTQQQAINYLNQFLSRVKATRGMEAMRSIQNKYMQIIDEAYRDNLVTNLSNDPLQPTQNS